MFGRSSKHIRVEVFGKTDLGRTRDHNEDRFLVADLTRKAASLQPEVRRHDIGPRGTLLVVADGMGGAAAGELTEEEAAQSERRNIILQALGPDPKVKVDLTHQEVRRGDILVLCSDGLSGQVKKEEIAEIVSAAPDLSTACDRLIALANERGGPDNITVVVARFDGEGLRFSGGGQQEDVGHQVYPLIDTETSTEPVPIYKGSRPPMPNKEKEARKQTRTLVLAVIAVAAALVWYLTRNP
ncbi:MAG: hypothetical protein DMD48_00485 [Gemmatimonadetes bacterium]|nr:MAG: hypothetical protein DMD48_00485 [Gemmatimonadota bacterium]